MYDPISQDPPHNPDFPATMSDFELRYQEAILNGVIYHPVGEGLYPLILLLHGIPGHERNLDFAQILRRAGYAVCVFHYRGSWGSGGDYRFVNVLDDVKAVLEYFRQADIAEKYRIDANNIITIGHSLGGWASLMTAAEGYVDTAGSLSGANVGLWGQQLLENPELVRPMFQAFIESTLSPLHGASAEDIIAETENNHTQWDLLQYASALKDKKLVILGAKRDEVVSVFDHHMPLVNALKDAGATDLTSPLIASDHSYSGNRIEVARILLDWLK